ncbi:UDP-N-acetylmuramoyl-L-alanyl-D-glutamate--2,6-diaminopimelate ligase [Candidatus Bipolaricaulota bacterium]|nr:UDP-N-acetylmuramoyl-L-alanyl-D-glutamate--2,6-diaminopimelate ligase [Candidatus Bipolaricaulota bacterium]
MKKGLPELLGRIEYQEVHGEKDKAVSGISHDSRAIEEGDLFLAIPGGNVDGHDFIAEAVDNGAEAIVGEKKREELCVGPVTYIRVRNSRKQMARISSSFYDDPTDSLFTIGITGTNGKTTTTHLTEEVLGKEETDAISTITNEAVPGQEGPVTTPESPRIQEIARDILKSGKTNFVLEVSSHSLELDRVAGINFDVGLFTNLTRDHLDYHSSIGEYKNAKKKLFHCLNNGDTAILNDDEDFSEEIEKVANSETVKYGLTGSADVSAGYIKRTKKGISFKVHSPWGSAKIESGLFGVYNVYNALGAITVGLTRGIELSEIAVRLERLNSLPGRMEKYELNNGADIYVDFAHNPGALERTLAELSHLYESVSVVFGCGGESDHGKRPEMGKVAEQYGSMVYLTDDNPKEEDRMKILREIEKGMSKNSSHSVVPNRKEAIEQAIDDLEPESSLLIAGKGHESYQIVEGEWINYDDREYVEKLCREKSLI